MELATLASVEVVQVGAPTPPEVNNCPDVPAAVVFRVVPLPYTIPPFVLAIPDKYPSSVFVVADVDENPLASVTMALLAVNAADDEIASALRVLPALV